MIQRLRIASLIGVHLLILAHIYIFGDKTIGSIDFQEFFHGFIKYGVINSGVLLVFIAFVTTLIFGRFFCGWACHFGAIQELSWWVLSKMGIKPKTINSRLTTIIPIFLLFNFYIIPNILHAIDNPWNHVRINLGVPEIWAFLPGFFIGSLTFLIDGFLIVYFLGRKGFCRFLCPWGAFLKFPNSLAMFKVRNTGGCIESGNCTSSCPVGIDVNYEINNYQKVTNTNCTSCMICIDGCPSSTLEYKWSSPLEENFKFKYYLKNSKMFNHVKFIDKFKSLYSKDYMLLPLSIFFGLCIDGLYGFGHFLSFGISIIVSFQIIKLKYSLKNISLNRLLISLIFFIFIWHGVIKFSIWKGMMHYNNMHYGLAIPHLQRAVKIYPKSIGKFHLILGHMYLETGNIEAAKFNANKARIINPDHNAPIELLNKINDK